MHHIELAAKEVRETPPTPACWRQVQPIFFIQNEALRASSMVISSLVKGDSPDHTKSTIAQPSGG